MRARGIKRIVSDNQLIGEIPLEIGYLTNLKTFVLNSNNLTGVIHIDIFSNLVDLRFLIINNNNLSGNIPDNICELNNLDFVNFEQNHFCPPYPDCIVDYVGEQDCGD